VKFRVGAFELSKHGASRWDFSDPYHLAVTLSWPVFFVALFGINVGINLGFAALYAVQPESVSHANGFFDDFFFSIETLATVGYGDMAPASLYGHIVASAETACGLTFAAIFTGLIFVRFSRPRAKILFADQAVVTGEHGQSRLMLRIANGRVTLLADVSARLSLFFLVRGSDGQLERQLHDLPLERAEMPVFALTWTLVHLIDEASPLAGQTTESLRKLDARMIATVTARDIALGATVYAMHDLLAEDLLFAMRYQKALSVEGRGRSHADLTQLSAVEPDGPS